MFARVLVILFAVVVVAVGGAIGYFVLGDSNSILNSGVGQLADPLAPVDPQDSTKQVVTVPPGATAASIGTTLQQRGLVRSAIVFRLAAEQAGVGTSLAAGDYELSRSMSTNDIIQILSHGQVKRGLRLRRGCRWGPAAGRSLRTCCKGTRSVDRRASGLSSSCRRWRQGRLDSPVRIGRWDRPAKACWPPGD